MCRNIRQLHNFAPPATSDEVYAASLQATAHLLEHLTTTAPPKDREVEAAKARARSAERYGRPVATG